jgi:glutaminase
MRSVAGLLAAFVIGGCAHFHTHSHTSTQAAAPASATCPEVEPVAGRVASEGAPSPGLVKPALDGAFADGNKASGGKNADYIPVLAKVNSKLYSAVVVTTDGQIYQLGDATHLFSIQSIEKPFTFALDVDKLGAAEAEKKIGVAATGMPFNSIVAIELQKETRPPPGNPLVNAGAIASVSFVPGASANERWQHLLDNLSGFAGRELGVDDEVYKSETATNTRNRAIAWLMAAYESMGSDPMEALDLYTRACSVAVTARDLAVMGATLANGGVNPLTHQRVVSAQAAERVLAVMMTAGLYENSGTWAYEVGVPAKSGVGGGIVAVVPGRYAIATFAPPLDAAGNSVRGQAAISSFVKRIGGNLFASAPQAQGQKQ